ncbi:MAG: ceramidase domain-containing protein [Candidatus Pacebacteria bacterium]|nr:ceramidase domain-containing protein [Candidatus Paceibacterota bacterium]MBP9840407.1 ceramidase domain-containing protein [Candidatus Paceibacterota bacterium]
MYPFGPQYCETPDVLTAFPAETWNTWSNLIIVAFGLLALYLVYRRAPRAYDLWVLGILLVTNGVGSLLWHGLRTPWALAFDTTPGLLFLLFFVYFWARTFYGWLGAGLMFVAFLALQYLSALLVDATFPELPFFAGVAIPVVLLGLLLTWRSYRVSGRAALLGILALVLALSALLFRSIDLWACEYITMGTHFLWHGLLSAGAFSGILSLLALRSK